MIGRRAREVGRGAGRGRRRCVSDVGVFALADLDEFLTERLARYKHPKALEVVDALPRNPAGKVLKTELRTRFGTANVD